MRLHEALSYDTIALRPLNYRISPTGRKPDPRTAKVIMTRDGQNFMLAWADTLNYIKGSEGGGRWSMQDVLGREDWQPLKYSNQFLGLYPTFRVVFRWRSSEDL